MSLMHSQYRQIYYISNFNYRPGATYTDKGLDEAVQIFRRTPNTR